jgi:hypothetical protein
MKRMETMPMKWKNGLAKGEILISIIFFHMAFIIGIKSFRSRRDPMAKGPTNGDDGAEEAATEWSRTRLGD